MHIDYATLRRYYASPDWQVTRGKLLYERKGKCEKCGSTKSLQAHHLHYRHLLNEPAHMDCLQLLCKVCHDAIEARKRRKKSSRGLRESKNSDIMSYNFLQSTNPYPLL